MQNKSALLLSLTAAAAAAALSGCVSTGPVDPERAAKHTPEYQYQPKLSRANNLATEFGVKHIMDRPAPKDVKLTSDGSMLLDGAVWGALHGNVAGSGILSGTADWNIGFGLWLAQSLLLPSTDPTPDCWWDTSAPKKLRTGKPPSTLSSPRPSLPSPNHLRSRISSRTIKFHTTSTKGDRQQ